MQKEGGHEVSQAAYLAYEASQPVTGTASKGAALFRKKAAAEAKKRIKKVEAGKKLAKKNLDMVVANNLKVAGAGFETDTNVVTMITDTEVLELPIMNKEEVAFHIIDQILSMQNTDR